MSIALLRQWLGPAAPSSHDTELRRLVRDALIEHDAMVASVTCEHCGTFNCRRSHYCECCGQRHRDVQFTGGVRDYLCPECRGGVCDEGEYVSEAALTQCPCERCAGRRAEAKKVVDDILNADTEGEAP